jgi:hypothetical protein
MALPTSGPLSIGAIRTELESGSGSLRTLSAAAGFSTPDSISEFYGYSNLPDFDQNTTVSGIRKFPSNNISHPVTGSGTEANPWTMTQTGYTDANFDDEIGYWFGWELIVGLIDSSYTYNTRVRMRISSYSPAWFNGENYFYHNGGFVWSQNATTPTTTWQTDPNIFQFNPTNSQNIYRWFFYSSGSFTNNFAVQAWIEVL